MAAFTCRTGVASAFGLAIVVAAAGCGGSTPTAVPATAEPTLPELTAPPSTGTPEPELTFAVLDACAVLSQKDAEVIAGTPLETGVPGNPLEPSCRYTGPVTGPLGQVEIYIGAGAKKTYDIDVALNHVFTPVAGIGDEAYREDNAIFFRKGTTWVAIKLVRLNDPAENIKALEDAARKVAIALP